jgi:hypothetical protein
VPSSGSLHRAKTVLSKWPVVEYAAQLHAWTRIKISRFLLNTECIHTTLPGLYPYLGVKVAPGRLFII